MGIECSASAGKKWSSGTWKGEVARVHEWKIGEVKRKIGVSLRRQIEQEWGKLETPYTGSSEREMDMKPRASEMRESCWFGSAECLTLSCQGFGDREHHPGDGDRVSVSDFLHNASIQAPTLSRLSERGIDGERRRCLEISTTVQRKCWFKKMLRDRRAIRHRLQRLLRDSGNNIHRQFALDKRNRTLHGGYRPKQSRPIPQSDPRPVSKYQNRYRGLSEILEWHPVTQRWARRSLVFFFYR